MYGVLLVSEHFFKIWFIQAKHRAEFGPDLKVEKLWPTKDGRPSIRVIAGLLLLKGGFCMTQAGTWTWVFAPSTACGAWERSGVDKWWPAGTNLLEHAVSWVPWAESQLVCWKQFQMWVGVFYSERILHKHQSLLRLKIHISSYLDVPGLLAERATSRERSSTEAHRSLQTVKPWRASRKSSVWFQAFIDQLVQLVQHDEQLAQFIFGAECWERGRMCDTWFAGLPCSWLLQSLTRDSTKIGKR